MKRDKQNLLVVIFTLLFTTSAIAQKTVTELTDKLNTQAKKGAIALADIPDLFDVIIIDQELKNTLSSLSITTPAIKSDAKSITITGSITVFGNTCKSELYIEKTGETASRYAKTSAFYKAIWSNRLIIELPNAWSITKAFPVLSKYSAITFTNPRFIVTTFKPHYPEPLYNIRLMPGVNFIGELTLAMLKVEADFAATVQQIIERAGGKLVMYGALPRNISQSSFKTAIAVAKESQLLAGNLLPLDQLSMPESFKATLRSAPIGAPDAKRAEISNTPEIKLDVYQVKPRLTIAGLISLSGIPLKIDITIKKIKEIETEAIIYLTDLTTKPSIPFFALSRLFNTLQQFDTFNAARIWLFISSYSSTNPATALRLDRGLNLSMAAAFGSLPIEPALKDRLNLLLNVPKEKLVLIQGLIPPSIDQAKFSVDIPSREKCTLTALINVKNITMPDTIKKELSALQLENPTISMDYAKTIANASITSPITLNNQTVQGIIRIEQQKDKSYSSSLTLKPNADYKLSQLFPSLKSFDLQNLLITIADGSMYDETNKTTIPAGLTIRATITDFKKFDKVNTFLTKVIAKTNPEFSMNNMILTSKTTKNDINFQMSLPSKIIFDLKTLAQKTKQTPFIETISLSDITISINSQGKEIITASLNLYYKGSTAPWTVPAHIAIDSSQANVICQLKSLSKMFGKSWLSADDLTIEMPLNYIKLAAAEKVPNNIQFKGTLRVGTGEGLFTMKSTGAVGTSGQNIGSCSFTGVAPTVTTTNLLSLLTAINQQPISISSPSTIKINDALTVITLEKALINQKEYLEGISFSGEGTVGSLKGSVSLTILSALNQLVGTITLNPYKSSLLQISDLSAAGGTGTSAQITIDISANRTPDQQIFNLLGTISIPTLNLKYEGPIAIVNNGATIKFTGKIFNRYQADCVVTFNLKNPEEFNLIASLGQDFSTSINQYITAAIAQLQIIKPADLDIITTSITTIQEALIKISRPLSSRDRSDLLKKTSARLDHINKQLEEAANNYERASSSEKNSLLIKKNFLEETVTKEREGLLLFEKELAKPSESSEDQRAPTLNALSKILTSLSALKTSNEKMINRVKKLKEDAAFAPEKIVLQDVIFRTSGTEIKNNISPKVSFSIPITGGNKISFTDFAFNPKLPELFFIAVAKNIINYWQ